MFSNASLSHWALSLLIASLALSVAQRRSQRIISSPDIPVTEFACTGRPPGYYADVETGCQVYHMCAEGGQQFSYRCPNTTLFQQRMLICAHWYQVNCSRSESHYGANLLIGQRDKPFVNENENTYYINRKQIENLTNPEILQRLGQSVRDQSSRKPKAQSNNVQLNQFEKYNLKRSDTHLVGNHGNVNQNAARSIASSTTVNPINTGGLQNFNSGQGTSQTTKEQFNYFNRNVFTTLKPTVTTQSKNVFNSFNQQVSKTPISQFQSFPPTQTPFTNPNTELNIDFVPPPIAEMEEAETSHANILNIPHQEISTTTIKSETVNPRENTPLVNFQPPSFASGITEKPAEYTDLPNDQYNVFINRFNPNEDTKTTTSNPSETTEHYTFINRFNPNIDNSDSYSGMIDSEQEQSRPKPVHVIKVPLFDLEPPLQDSDESDSNQIELHFQDPRRTFFIPESGSGEFSKADDVPIVVTIPLHTSADSPPMWFRTNKSKDPCARCHPSFIVNKNNCMPCVIIR